MTHQDGTDSACGSAAAHGSASAGSCSVTLPADFMFRDLPNSYTCGPNGCRAYTTEELNQ